MEALDLIFSLVLTLFAMVFIGAVTHDVLRAVALKQSVYRAVINRANDVLHRFLAWPTLATLAMGATMWLQYTDTLSGYAAAGAGLLAYAVPARIASKALDVMREAQGGIKPDDFDE